MVDSPAPDPVWLPTEVAAAATPQPGSRLADAAWVPQADIAPTANVPLRSSRPRRGHGVAVAVAMTVVLCGAAVALVSSGALDSGVPQRAAQTPATEPVTAAGAGENDEADKAREARERRARARRARERREATARRRRIARRRAIRRRAASAAASAPAVTPIVRPQAQAPVRAQAPVQPQTAQQPQTQTQRPAAPRPPSQPPVGDDDPVGRQPPG